MRKLSLFLVVVSMVLAAVNAPCSAQDLKLYPGAKLDEKSSREASAAAPGKQSEVYTTGDAFEKYMHSTRAHTKSSRCPVHPQSCPLDNKLSGPFSSLTEGRIWRVPNTG